MLRDLPPYVLFLCSCSIAHFMYRCVTALTERALTVWLALRSSVSSSKPKHSDSVCEKRHNCVYGCASPNQTAAHVCPCMCRRTSWYESSLILRMCVFVFVSMYEPRPWRFPLSCSLKFAPRLFHWTAALSPKAVSRLLLPFLSRKISLFVCVSFLTSYLNWCHVLLYCSCT